MASPSSAPTSLGVAFYRAAPPTISLASAAPVRGVDAAASQQLRAARRSAPSPRGRPGTPKEGSGGKVHAAPLAATARVAMRGPTPPSSSPPEGSGGKVHAAPALAPAVASLATRARLLEDPPRLGHRQKAPAAVVGSSMLLLLDY